MKRLLLVLALGSSLASTAWAGNDSSPPATLSAPKWTLTVLEPRVAAGGLPTEAHQSEFVVRALDSKDKPLVGLPVELPSIWNGSERVDNRKPDDPKEVMPRVRWRSGKKVAITDARGEARGLFTSGSRMGQLSLHGPNQTQADLTLIHDDGPDPYQGSQSDFTVGTPSTQRYLLSIQRGNRAVPITGHHIKHTVRKVVLEAWPSTGLDKNGNPQIQGPSYPWEISCPQENASPQENARWKKILSWIEIGKMKEVSPGVYSGDYKIKNIKNEFLDGVFIARISTLAGGVEDEGVWAP